MIISNLQYIESATETEVQGGDGGRWRSKYSEYSPRRKEKYPDDSDTDALISEDLYLYSQTQ